MVNRTKGLVGAALTALALLAGTATAHAADPFHGLYTENNDAPVAAIAGETARQAGTGVGLIRESLDWADVERAPGVYDWSTFDAVVIHAARSGMTVLPIVYEPPPWRSARPYGDTRRGMFPPARNGDYAAFLRMAIDRYGPLGRLWCKQVGVLRIPLCDPAAKPIRAWQVWNEPDLPAYWRSGPDPKAYAALLREAFLSIKLADPGAEVVLGGMSGAATLPGAYLTQLYRAGAGPFFDTIAVHPYAAGIGGMFERIFATRAIADAAGFTFQPMRIDEYGWASSGRSNFGGAVPPACQAALAAIATRRLADFRAALRIKGIVWFNWNDRDSKGSDIWPYFTGLTNLDGSPKPALATFTNAVRGGAVDFGAVDRDCPPGNRY